MVCELYFNKTAIKNKTLKNLSFITVIISNKNFIKQNSQENLA